MIALDQQGETTMVDLEVPVEGVALDALDAFFSSDQSPPDSMMLSDLDGFLTAIAIGLELVRPTDRRDHPGRTRRPSGPASAGDPGRVLCQDSDGLERDRGRRARQ